MNIMKIRYAPAFISLVAICLLHPGIARADFNIKKWEYYRDVDTKKAQAGENYRIVADKTIYDESLPSLGGIRLVTTANEETPYEIFVFRGETENKNIESKIIQNYKAEDNSNILVLDIGEQAQKNNRVALTIDDRNFGRKVLVEGSSDLSNWVVLDKDSYIYDFTFGGGKFPQGGQIKWQRSVKSEYMVDFSYNTSSRDTAISYKENGMRYIKLTIFAAEDEEPLTITKAEISSYITIPADQSEYTAEIKDVSFNKEEKRSEVVLDFGAKNLPVHKVDIRSSSKNYYRAINIYASNDMKEWSYAGQGEIFDYSIKNFNDSKNYIEFGEKQARYFKLVVLDRDNQPIKITSIMGTSYNRSVVFPYQAQSTLQLYYGNKSAKTPSYDYSRFVRKIDIRNVEKLTIGSQIRNTLFMPGPWTEQRPYLLWVALVGIVIILLLLVASMMKKIK